MTQFVWWWFAITAALLVPSLVRSDASKLKNWHERDQSYVVIDRIGTLITIAIHLAVLWWWPR